MKYFPLTFIITISLFYNHIIIASSVDTWKKNEVIKVLKEASKDWNQLDHKLLT